MNKTVRSMVSTLFVSIWYLCGSSEPVFAGTNEVSFVTTACQRIYAQVGYVVDQLPCVAKNSKTIDYRIIHPDGYQQIGSVDFDDSTNFTFTSAGLGTTKIAVYRSIPIERADNQSLFKGQYQITLSPHRIAIRSSTPTYCVVSLNETPQNDLPSMKNIVKVFMHDSNSMLVEDKDYNCSFYFDTLSLMEIYFSGKMIP